jgi:ribosomal protein S18 acetylase RimI-like enzyme
MITANTLRRAQATDARALAQLAESTFRAAFAAANSDADMQRHCEASYGEVLQRAEILDPGRETWVATAHGSLIAFLQLRLAMPCPAGPPGAGVEIQRLYVEAAYHGRGVAHELMALAIRRATAAGAATLWLGVWEHNPRALAFYRKWGFATVGEHIFRVGEDPQRDLLLSRSVPAA